MITKQILGIYVDSDRFHYVFANRGIAGFRLGSPVGGVLPAGEKSGNGPQLLKSFLKGLYPDRKIAIHLCLPRSQIYARRIELPAMPIEDALSAIKNSLSMYAHLEPSEMFYDVNIASAGKDGVKAMLFYAAAGDIDKYRQIFSETGHLEGLKTIFPLSYGVSSLFDLKKQDGYAAFLIDQEMNQEMVVCYRNHVQFSMTCPSGGDEAALLMQTAEKSFPDIKGKIIDFNRNDLTEVLPAYRKKCRFLPSVRENRASAALAPALEGFQQISLDGGPVSIHFVNPVIYIIPFLCVLILCLFVVSERTDKNVSGAEKQLSLLKEDVNRLELRLAPLQQRVEQAEKEEEFRRHVLEFMKNRPDLYAAINAVAELVPDGTWFSSLTFNNDRIVLRGQGDDALKAVEALRTSPLFSNVTLRGSVNRSVKGEERFSVSLDLVKGIDMEKEKDLRDPQGDHHE